jgi:hypothetical protein
MYTVVLNPSLLVATTSYDWGPSELVPSVPGLVEPVPSLHDVMPGLPAPFAQEKAVGTTWFTS